MDADERFDAEMRAGLRDLAGRPAPDRLQQRVAAIPDLPEPVASRWSLGRFATAFATVAVIVVVAAIVVIVRPWSGAPNTGTSPTPVAPTASPASPSPTASPSPMPSLTPTPTVTPAPSGPPVGGPVPAGFQPLSVTFASPQLGWVLGTAPCASPPCTSIVRTSDGGRTWVGIPAPRTPTVTGVPPETPGAGVSGLRFADPLDGWAFGPDLWATHDGGATWHSLALPGTSSAYVVDLEASAGYVHAVLFDQDGIRIATSPVGRDDWRLAPVVVPFGAGPVPRPQLVLSGTGGWVVEVDRDVVGGARLVKGSWVAWTPPCAGTAGPAVLGASSATELVAACDVGLWSTPQGEQLYVSHDGGQTFARIAGAVPLQEASGIASSGTLVTLVAGATDHGWALVATFDGGKTWAPVFTSQDAFTDLGFTTTSQGVVIEAAGANGILLMTRDSGHTWTPVSFAGS